MIVPLLAIILFSLLVLLHNNKKDEANVDTLVDAIQSIHHEFNVDPALLQAHFHLIQWVTNLSLYLFASVPEYKHRKGPGVSPSQEDVPGVPKKWCFFKHYYRVLIL